MHLRQLLRRVAARRHDADQRQAYIAAGIDDVGIGDAFLPEHHDAQTVAGIERVGLLGRRVGICIRRRGVGPALPGGAAY